MTIPAYHDARNDSDLIGFPMAVYLYLLHEQLSPVEDRPVKTEALVSHFHCSEDTIARTFRVLVDRNYLTRGPSRAGEARTYRLVYSRLP